MAVMGAVPPICWQICDQHLPQIFSEGGDRGMQVKLRTNFFTAKIFFQGRWTEQPEKLQLHNCYSFDHTVQKRYCADWVSKKQTNS